VAPAPKSVGTRLALSKGRLANPSMPPAVRVDIVLKPSGIRGSAVGTLRSGHGAPGAKRIRALLLLTYFGGPRRPRLAKTIPTCVSAALRSRPAFFRASVLSGPAGIKRAACNAAAASACKSQPCSKDSVNCLVLFLDENNVLNDQRDYPDEQCERHARVDSQHDHQKTVRF
jgi:hypothetical protein